MSLQAQEVARSADVVVRRAIEADLGDVLRVQHEAFRRVAVMAEVDDEHLPPMQETLADLESLFAKGVRTFVAVEATGAGERVVGTVRAAVRADGTVEIGRLAVATAFLRRGVARALMLALEADFPESPRFVLFTAADALAPLGLYASLGYRIFRRQDQEHWTLVWLAKGRATGACATSTPHPPSAAAQPLPPGQDARYTDTHDS